MHFKIALHVHTRRSDGVRDPNEVLRLHQELGYNVVALTDHDRELTHRELAELQIPEGMYVLRGSEVNFNGWHIGHIWGETEGKLIRILNHPRRYGISPQMAESIIERYGFDAVEMTQEGIYDDRYSVVKYPKVVSDDSHFPYEIGGAWIEMDLAEFSADAIIDAIKAEQFVCAGPKYNPKPKEAAAG